MKTLCKLLACIFLGIGIASTYLTIFEAVSPWLMSAGASFIFALGFATGAHTPKGQRP